MSVCAKGTVNQNMVRMVRLRNEDVLRQLGAAAAHVSGLLTDVNMGLQLYCVQVRGVALVAGVARGAREANFGAGPSYVGWWVWVRQAFRLRGFEEARGSTPQTRQQRSSLGISGRTRMS